MKIRTIILSTLFIGVLFLLGCEKKVDTETKTTAQEVNLDTSSNEATENKLFGAPIKFQTTDLDGNELDESIFKNADVTMVNIWASWCGPCRAELPEIGKVAESIKEKNGQVISIIHDAHADMEDLDAKKTMVKEILTSSNCKYVTLVNSIELEPIFNDIQAFPTTFFVDKNGNLIGQPLIGGRSQEQFEQAFEIAFSQIK